jgi:lipopolysaccharide export system protein LptC
VSAQHLSLVAAPGRRASIRRWQQRSKVIRVLRIALPATIALILLSLAGSVAYNSLTGQQAPASSPDAPIRLVKPRFIGRDDRGRAFVLTAVTATRDPKDYQRVFLDKPILVLDTEGPDPVRINAAHGVYHEGDRKLEMSGGVRLASIQAAFDTAASMYDTRTGELIGSGPIQGAGPLGEIDAKSYGVYEKGNRMVFTGGVHTRMNSK